MVMTLRPGDPYSYELCPPEIFRNFGFLAVRPTHEVHDSMLCEEIEGIIGSMMLQKQISACGAAALGGVPPQIPDFSEISENFGGA